MVKTLKQRNTVLVIRKHETFSLGDVVSVEISERGLLGRCRSACHLNQ